MEARILMSDGRYCYANSYYVVQYENVVHVKDTNLADSFQPFFGTEAQAKHKIYQQHTLKFEQLRESIQKAQAHPVICKFLMSALKDPTVQKNKKESNLQDSFDSLIAFYQKNSETNKFIELYLHNVKASLASADYVREHIHDQKPIGDRQDNRAKKLKDLKETGIRFVGQKPEELISGNPLYKDFQDDTEE